MGEGLAHQSADHGDNRQEDMHRNELMGPLVDEVNYVLEEGWHLDPDNADDFSDEEDD